MADDQTLLDAFADARRTWDELIGLQPDIIAGSRNLDVANADELQRRVQAHLAAMDVLADACEAEPNLTADQSSSR